MAFKIGDKFSSCNGTHGDFVVFEYIYDGKPISISEIAKRKITPNQLSYKLIRPSTSYTINEKKFDLDFQPIILDEIQIQKNINVGSWQKVK